MKTVIKAYEKGARLEREVRDRLEEAGYEVYRVRGSKEVDLIAFKKDNRFLAAKIEVKSWSSFIRLTKSELSFIKENLFDKPPPDFFLIIKKGKNEWCLFFKPKFEVICIPFEKKPDFSRCGHCILPKRHKQILFNGMEELEKGGKINEALL
jgi:Holliday junction resolvase